jgi:hypothetical protein
MTSGEHWTATAAAARDSVSTAGSCRQLYRTTTASCERLSRYTESITIRASELPCVAVATTTPNSRVKSSGGAAPAAPAADHAAAHASASRATIARESPAATENAPIGVVGKLRTGSETSRLRNTVRTHLGALSGSRCTRMTKQQQSRDDMYHAIVHNFRRPIGRSAGAKPPAACPHRAAVVAND